MQSQRESAVPVLRLPHVRADWRAYAQLIRLPNVFTAMADICLGWLCALATGTPAARWPTFLLLMGASACLYSGGMIWNDFFDIEQDKRERPFRPLPSGRISRRVAGTAGVIALLLGMALACQAALIVESPTWQPLITSA